MSQGSPHHTYQPPTLEVSFVPSPSPVLFTCAVKGSGENSTFHFISFLPCFIAVMLSHSTHFTFTHQQIPQFPSLPLALHYKMILHPPPRAPGTRCINAT
ncbi:hypothetical protein TRVL_01775 [Trypanosoma vivax]|nr:hypothetical protein TRVL_01775 [Trypanosoma vivax]